MRPLSLGTIIELLERCNADAEVRFDFCNLVPAGIYSYRGFYNHLAVGHKEWHAVKVSEFLTALRDANGKTFEGYKGGDYTMHDQTPVWVALYGQTTDTGITGVIDKEPYVYLRTGLCEW